MALTIRPATLDDLQSILAIEQASANAARWSREQYSRVVESGLVLVADDKETVAGFICAQGVAGEWEIENIVVAESSRRRGIGNTLVSELLKQIGSRSGRTVYLEVRESNHPARCLYQKHGFVEIGLRRSYYQRPAEDALLYRLSLTTGV